MTSDLADSADHPDRSSIVKGRRRNEIFFVSYPFLALRDDGVRVTECIR
jgi:hypothetical protein